MSRSSTAHRIRERERERNQTQGEAETTRTMMIIALDYKMYSKHPVGAYCCHAIACMFYVAFFLIFITKLQ